MGFRGPYILLQILSDDHLGFIFCQKPFHTSTVTPLVEFKRDGICKLNLNYSQMILMIFR